MPSNTFVRVSLTHVIDVIEAAYDVETTDADWLKGLARAAEPIVDRGLGAAAYLYDSHDPAALRVLDAALPERFDPVAFKGFLESVPPGYVASTWVKPFGLASSTEGFEGPLSAALEHAFGARDVIAINGYDPSGFGVWLGAVTPEREVLSDEQTALFERIAPHLASAYRLRRRAPREPDAVLDPAGKIHDARGEAKLNEARDSLRQAVAAVEAARGRLRREDPARAVGSWKGLVSARWTLVDRFERDGKRYILAQENSHEVTGLRELSPRERAVLAATAAGHHDKLIAYELGLAPSTVRVLIFRAIRKLGASSRADAIARYRAASSTEA